jgi:hypothetical protein
MSSSPAVIETQPNMPHGSARTRRQPHPRSAGDRIAQLERTIERIRQGAGLESTRSAQEQEARQLKAENARLEHEIRSTLALLSALQIRLDLLEQEEQERVAEEQRKRDETWKNFHKECSNVRSRTSDWDHCMRTIGEVPVEWLRCIAELSNGPDLLLFLGRSPKLLKCLRELRPEVAIRRLQQAGLDLEMNRIGTGA